MAINPFMAPILLDLHGAPDMATLGELLLDAHLMQGHATGFGKLIDERILPEAFGTTKLTSKYRRSNPPLETARYDEIDHIVPRTDGTRDLLSLKASKWTIQLTMAVGLNKNFSEILDHDEADWHRIVLGVFYGSTSGLTDKYDIARGINRGANHDVRDIRHFVDVRVGREFWDWLNDDPLTQDWVLEGIQTGLIQSKCRETAQQLLGQYRDSFEATFAPYINADSAVDWHGLLRSINT